MNDWINFSYLVIAPGLLSGGSSEGQGAIAAEGEVDVRQVQSTGYGTSRRGQVASERLLQRLVWIRGKRLLVKSLKSASSYRLCSQIHFPPRSSRYRCPCFNCACMLNNKFLIILIMG